MIKSIKSKALKKLWVKGDTSKVDSQHVERLQIRLNLLDAAVVIDDMDALVFDSIHCRGTKIDGR